MLVTVTFYSGKLARLKVGTELRCGDSDRVLCTFNSFFSGFAQAPRPRGKDLRLGCEEWASLYTSRFDHKPLISIGHEASQCSWWPNSVGKILDTQ